MTITIVMVEAGDSQEHVSIKWEFGLPKLENARCEEALACTVGNRELGEGRGIGAGHKIDPGCFHTKLPLP